MNSSFTFSLGKQFATEFQYYTEEQQNAVLDFLDIYEQHGLSDFSMYQGKISPSWRGKNITADTFNYAYKYQLWHYHIGLPEYLKSRFKDYYTSDWVLHFIWEKQGTHIILVDLCYHYKADGSFHLPSEKYLQV